MKKLFFTFAAVMLSVGIFSVCGAEASSKKAVNLNALKAYNAELRKEERSKYGPMQINRGDIEFGGGFALIDINRDGVSELITTADDGYHTGLFAYVNGKMKRICSGFAGGISFYPKKSIFKSATYHMGYHIEDYFTFDGKNRTRVAKLVGEDYVNKKGMISVKYTYKVKGKAVSKKKYFAYVKQLRKGAKEKNYTWTKNTAQNREKFLKVSSDLAKIATGTLAERAFDEYVGEQEINNYAYVDMDQNGVPELITGFGCSVFDTIYCYQNGQIKKVVDPDNASDGGTGIGAINAHISFYPSAKVVYVSGTCSSYGEGYYYRFQKNKMKLLASWQADKWYDVVTGEPRTDEEAMEGWGNAPHLYKVEGKTVSEREYNRYIKELLKNAKAKEYEWVEFD